MAEGTGLGSNATVAIIGAGQGGGEVATALRQNRFEGRIVLFGDEPYLPYQRPPLSKAYLARQIDREALIYKAASAYEKANVEVRLGVHVEAIDRTKKELTLPGGEKLPYDAVVLATGGTARKINVPGADLGEIFYLRSIADVDLLQPRLVAGKRLAIVGGGYIGLEVAAVAVKHGLTVTVLEGMPRVLARVTAPALSEFYERTHRKAGVDIKTGVSVSGFSAGPDGKTVATVDLADGGKVPADFVLVGIGLAVHTELASAAGLEVDGGIVVDAVSRTNDPAIYAIGDCAMHANHGFLQRKIRIESVPNALEQARIVAAHITGRPIPATTAPWFWSDQYDLQLQMVGISEGYDNLVIRGSTDTTSFIAFYLKDGRVIAADAVNRPAEFMAAKRFVGERVVIPPEQLGDEQISLKQLLGMAKA